MLFFCKKCGRYIYEFEGFNPPTKCDVCSSPVYEVPRKYIDNFRWRDGDGKQALLEEVIKPSPEFDPYLFEHRDEILSSENLKLNAALAHGASILEEQNRVPKCPTCGSTSIQKISTTRRLVTTGLFGLASSDIGKTMLCKNCGYKW